MMYAEAVCVRVSTHKHRRFCAVLEYQEVLTSDLPAGSTRKYSRAGPYTCAAVLVLMSTQSISVDPTVRLSSLDCQPAHRDINPCPGLPGGPLTYANDSCYVMRSLATERSPCTINPTDGSDYTKGDVLDSVDLGGLHCPSRLSEYG